MRAHFNSIKFKIKDSNILFLNFLTLGHLISMRWLILRSVSLTSLSTIVQGHHSILYGLFIQVHVVYWILWVLPPRFHVADFMILPILL